MGFIKNMYVFKEGRDEWLVFCRNLSPIILLLTTGFYSLLRAGFLAHTIVGVLIIILGCATAWNSVSVLMEHYDKYFIPKLSKETNKIKRYGSIFIAILLIALIEYAILSIVGISIVAGVTKL